MADDVEPNSMCFISHLHILFGRMSCLLSIFEVNWLVCFLSGGGGVVVWCCLVLRVVYIV